MRARATQLSERVEEVAPPTLVLPLDQAEELFSADAGAQAGQFLGLLASLVAQLDLVVAVTIRTDRYEMLQTHPALAAAASVVFDDLKPMPPTQFKEVITGPARRAVLEAIRRLARIPRRPLRHERRRHPRHRRVR